MIRKKILKTGLIAGAILLLVSGECYAAKKEDTTRYPDGTNINGVYVSQLTPEEAKSRIEQYYAGEYALTVRTADGKKEEIRGTDIGCFMQVTGDLSGILAAQNASGRQTGPGTDNWFRTEASFGYDENMLKQALGTLECVTSAALTEDAHITPYVEGKAFSIVPEVQGTEIDTDRLAETAKAALSRQDKILDLKKTGCYKEIRVTSDDAELNRLCSNMNRFRDVTITYRFGDSEEILEGTKIASWILGTAGTEIQVDRSKAEAFVNRLAEQYDTYGKTRLFETADGRQVEISGSYGWQISREEEVQALIGAVQACESCEREPVYRKKAVSRTENDFGTTYIEVDLAGQHLYFFENGTCIVDCPIVSGNVAKDCTTPEGLYTMYYKEKDRILRGKKLPDGTYEYESPVSYWMPFNGGIGLHDASWRGKFGGQIYRTNGSHGCINMPVREAAIVYEHAYAGIPVICHN